MKNIIKTDKAPEAIGPYSQAVSCGGFLFTAGQIALKPGGDGTIQGDVTEQTKQVLENLKAVLKAAGSDLGHIVKTTVYLTEPGHFTPMNDVYAGYFTKDHPARVAVFVKSLPKGALVEIDAIAKL
jgi:2-iminobutanoate/2-iminopropanoate deaminase